MDVEGCCHSWEQLPIVTFSVTYHCTKCKLTVSFSLLGPESLEDALESRSHALLVRYGGAIWRLTPGPLVDPLWNDYGKQAPEYDGLLAILNGPAKAGKP